MAQTCDSLSDSGGVRLDNRSSDDSLILDESNTGMRWMDTDTEPATFQIHPNFTSGHVISNRPSSAVELRGEWFREPWNGPTPKPMTPIEGPQSVYNVSMQTRLSLSGEESEMPLLSSETWVPGGFTNDVRHCHLQSFSSNNNSAWRRLMSATLLCLFFMIAEILGGLFAGSIAIMSDAAHLLSDLVGLIVSLSAVWLGQKPPTKTLSFGFHRAEVLGALFSIFVIWVLTGIFVYIAIMRLVHGNIEINADRMMAVAAGGIVINIIMGFILHGGCQQLNFPHAHGLGSHGHSHGHTDDHESGDFNATTSCSRRTNVNNYRANSENHSMINERSGINKRTNINVRAAAIHVLGDLIQSIGVFIAAVVIKFNPEANIADPICTFLFASLVLTTTIPLLRDTGLILLEGFPRTISYSHVFATLSDISGVLHVHSLHVWSLTAGKHALSVHLAVDPTTNRDAVTFRAQHVLQSKFGINFCTIQTESFDQVLMNTCTHCRPPVS